jgi:hypothetical protein
MSGRETHRPDPDPSTREVRDRIRHLHGFALLETAYILLGMAFIAAGLDLVVAATALVVMAGLNVLLNNAVRGGVMAGVVERLVGAELHPPRPPSDYTVTEEVTSRGD